MEEFIKLNSQTVGKDKIARLLQYFSKVLWYHVQKKQSDPMTVYKLKSLEYILSTFRKILRLGKSLEVLHSALKSIHCEDGTVRLAATMSKISSSIFLLTDHILWLGRSGLAPVETSKWSEISNRYWLYSIMLNLWRDFYEIYKIMEHSNIKIRFSWRMSFYTVFNQLLDLSHSILSDHKDIFFDTVKNACDVWIPLNSLGFTNFNPGVIGMLGMVSSIIGLISIIYPRTKLIHS